MQQGSCLQASGTTKAFGQQQESVVEALSDYRSALNRLLGLVDHERIESVRSGASRERIRYDLSRMRALLDKLGNPHLGIPTAHIAGTKGKGSTSAMCANILTRAGRRVGLFTSPHLHHFRERIQVDGEPITEDEFASLVREIWPSVQEVSSEDRQGGVTMFEALTAMAFVEFRRNADFQVLEVGLGGRLDTTNLADPVICAITSLSLDHTSVLGTTIQSIATEKAGIIKPGVPIISAPQVPEAEAVIRATCAQRGSPLLEVGKDLTWKMVSRQPDGQQFEVRSPKDRYLLKVPLLGDYQLENATISVGVVEAVRAKGIDISNAALETGLATVHWPCRLEVLSKDPMVVCDGAHNPYSAARLRETLPDYFEYDHLVYVVGLSADKNLEGIVKELAFLPPGVGPSGRPRTWEVIVTQSRHPRAASAEKVAEQFRSLSADVREVEVVHKAVDLSTENSGQYAGRGLKTLVLVTGSLFVAAEAREAILGIEPELYPEFGLEQQANRVEN